MFVRQIMSLVFVTAGLAACKGANEQPADNTATAPAAPATVTAKDNQSSASGLYTMELKLPELAADQAPLKDAINHYVDAQKKGFLTSLDAPGARDRAREMPWDLNLDVAVAAHTDRFINVQVDGSAFTGGAHPAPIVDSFTYDREAGRVVTLPELFTDPNAAETALAAESRRQLLGALDDQDDPLASTSEQIDEGTAPGKNHYRVFTLLTGDDGKVHGLTFIFPPYQVASYAAGAQAVDIPTEVFASHLKPEYRDAFR
ncbi:hypothetical protein FHW69_000555 [Luteibacter sp. Sphag1AF]|uniref:DUF3298 and DUF4163 domain-containing protein n=1 Tax=Luteibacter sp. Sphag1AF TaxID=2587031 RepID=UPI00160A2D8F|nr:DUF3298 and DUF4163 domain-containing protein [Luteibacter sp. Sphag1AF]MBB3225965.1 hypothetical protein [Luteibacter sp. Sphag1AF]